jgi:hypothetical protein
MVERVMLAGQVVTVSPVRDSCMAGVTAQLYHSFTEFTVGLSSGLT